MNMTITRSAQGSFWVSFCAHILLLCSFVATLHWQQTSEKRPAMYIPSYVYHKPTPVMRAPQQAAQKAVETSVNGIEKPMPTLTQSNMSSADSAKQNSQMVHMIGEKKVDKPLIKLLGQALAAHLTYPKMAVDFRLRGTTFVGFSIHPDGQVTNIQVVKSSGTEVLDQAAVTAVNAMSPVTGVAEYVPESKFLVAGIIFG